MIVNSSKLSIFRWLYITMLYRSKDEAVGVQMVDFWDRGCCSDVLQIFMHFYRMPVYTTLLHIKYYVCVLSYMLSCYNIIICIIIL